VNLPVLAESVHGLKNYDATFQTNLPTLIDQPEPDWHAWKQARDWDPSESAWSAGVNRGDALLHVLGKSADPDATDAVMALSRIDAAQPELSVYGLVMAASTRGNMAPNERIDNALRAMRRSDGDLDAIEFLVRNLYDMAGVARPVSEAFPANLEKIVEALIKCFLDLGWIAASGLDQLISVAELRLGDRPAMLESFLSAVGQNVAAETQ
jgi:hypothetical protein